MGKTVPIDLLQLRSATVAYLAILRGSAPALDGLAGAATTAEMEAGKPDDGAAGQHARGTRGGRHAGHAGRDPEQPGAAARRDVTRAGGRPPVTTPGGVRRGRPAPTAALFPHRVMQIRP